MQVRNFRTLPVMGGLLTVPCAIIDCTLFNLLRYPVEPNARSKRQYYPIYDFFVGSYHRLGPDHRTGYLRPGTDSGFCSDR